MEYGYEFIEKFIQLPFRLPPPTPQELADFLRRKLHRNAKTMDTKLPTPPIPLNKREASATPETARKAGPLETQGPTSVAGPQRVAGGGRIASKRPSPREAVEVEALEVEAVADEGPLEQPLLHAAQVLDGNPRRVNQLINLVRLQRRLARAQNLNLSDGQIAKWTAISLRWPRFILELTEMDATDRRQLLRDLMSDRSPDRPSAKYNRWDLERRMIEFLRELGPGQPAEQRTEGLDLTAISIRREHLHAEQIQRGEPSFDLTLPGVLDNLLRLAIAIPVAETTAGAEAKPEGESPIGPPAANRPSPR